MRLFAYGLSQGYILAPVIFNVYKSDLVKTW